MKNDVIYSLSVVDLQNVALQEIDRYLSNDEISVVRKLVEEKINWHDIIADSINELIISDNFKNELQH